jgi:uncharacterized protein
MARITHFDIGADDADRAIKFLEAVFGWKIEKWDNPSMNYWMITTGEGPGINGGMGLKAESKMPNMNTLDVESIDATLEAVKTNGGKVVSAKAPIAGIGQFAVVEDTEGNMFGLMEEDEKAGT